MPARPTMNHVLPGDETLWSAVSFAVRAPSTHNAQPWRWHVRDGVIHLYADASQPPSVVKFGDRDVLLSCGAALHHLRVALAASGWAATVRRLPEPARPDLLATVRPRQRVVGAREEKLAKAISRRRTDRRCYGSRAVPWTVLSDLTEAARAEGAVLRIVVSSSVRERLGSAIVATAPLEEGVEEEAVPVAGTAAVCGADGPVLRSPGHPGRDGSVLLALGTPMDERVSLLKAGEALSAVLLTATEAGLASCALSHPFLVPDIREFVRTTVFNWALYPQLAVRVGWPRPHAAPLPATPRRPVAEVLGRDAPGAPPRRP